MSEEKKSRLTGMKPAIHNDDPSEAQAERVLKILKAAEVTTVTPTIVSAGRMSGLLPIGASLGMSIENSLGSLTFGKTVELNETIEKLRREVDEKAADLKKSQVTASERYKLITELEDKVTELTEKAQFGFLLARVNEMARALLLNCPDFRQKFIDTGECNIYVMSVDIRRSTELMLKARSPQLFANFITTLCTDLEEVVKDHFGVFDKFTGDGILAFFPDFFSGEDAGHNVVAAADKCHKLFLSKYKQYRSSFTSILTNVGFGIGIDYGPAHLVQMAGGLTVVGAPVVYACRLGGAPAGATLLNQPAYEKISERFSEFCFFQETTLGIKNEGEILAYEVKLNSKAYKPRQPDWVDLLSTIQETSQT